MKGEQGKGVCLHCTTCYVVCSALREPPLTTGDPTLHRGAGGGGCGVGGGGDPAVVIVHATYMLHLPHHVASSYLEPTQGRSDQVEVGSRGAGREGNAV